MTTTMEFNTIKTIKLINKDSLLQKVYSAKYEDYKFIPLLTSAEANTLADKAIDTLRSIYESIILTSTTHSELYNKIETEVKTPRRYGKTQINADIKAQGGKATPLQETMLLIADLKAICSTLSDRGVSDRYRGTEKLTLENQRKIKAAIRNLQTQLNPILKKK